MGHGLVRTMGGLKVCDFIPHEDPFIEPMHQATNGHTRSTSFMPYPS